LEVNIEMFKQGFTVSGSSLKLLKPGERGVVSRLRGVDDRLSRKLKDMGIQVGTTITLERRFPRFVIKVGCNRFAIDNRVMNAVYLRLNKEQVAITTQPTAGTQFAGNWTTSFPATSNIRTPAFSSKP
jgi:ferrous iron transport protein A